MLSARLYDAVMSRAEQVALRDLRRELLAASSGDVLELGAGTRANVPYYPLGLRSLTLVEPDRHKRSCLLTRSGQARAHVVDGRAEALPVPDASADTVVATLVLCTVPDVVASQAEIRRVLRPGRDFAADRARRRARAVAHPSRPAASEPAVGTIRW